MKRNLVLALGLSLGAAALAATAKSYYCAYCGYKASSVRALTTSKCMRHPDGALKGVHVLYEGAEKEEYVCRHCGCKASSLRALTAGKCMRHPKGAFKGCHSPAL